jgi:hypothetical protein
MTQIARQNGPITVADATDLASVRQLRLEDNNALLAGALRELVKAIRGARVNRNGGADYYYSAPPIDRAIAQTARALKAHEGQPEEAFDDFAASLTAALTVHYPEGGAA